MAPGSSSAAADLPAAQRAEVPAPQQPGSAEGAAVTLEARVAALERELETLRALVAQLRAPSG